MTDFIIKKLPYDLSAHAGLALVGQYLKRINAPALIDPAYPVRSGVANSDLLKSYLGLLCLGKNDFDAIESFRGNKFFMRARFACRTLQPWREKKPHLFLKRVYKQAELDTQVAAGSCGRRLSHAGWHRGHELYGHRLSAGGPRPH